MQVEVTRGTQSTTEDNDQFRRRVGGDCVLRRNKVNVIQRKEEVKEFPAARKGSEDGGLGIGNNKEKRWWFKKVGPAQAPLQIRAGRGRARRTLKAGSQSA